MISFRKHMRIGSVSIALALFIVFSTYKVCINATKHSAVPENDYNIANMSLYRVAKRPGDSLNQSLFSFLDFALEDTSNLRFP